MKKELTPFQKRALHYDRHIALTANAGSGKTFVLAKRFVEILVQNNLPINKLVAITFTEKAAGELYAGISKEVRERLVDERDSKRLKILRRIRRQLVSANISTIHSFCTNLIKEFAPEIGVDTNFRPADSRVAKELLDVSMEDILNSRLREDHPNETLDLVRLFGSVKTLKKELSKLFTKRKTTLRFLEKIKNLTEEEIAKKHRAFFEERFRKYFGDIVEEFIEGARLLNQAVLRADSENGYALTAQSILERCEDKFSTVEKLGCLQKLKGNLFTKNGDKIRSVGYTKKLKDRGDLLYPLEQSLAILSQLSFSENPEAAELSLAKYQKMLLSVFEKILIEYERKKRLLGYLDFEDLLLSASKILKIPEAQKLLAERFEFIMVDEYQDTNEIQYEIIMPLLEQLKRGNLFVVGDDKQSIYMFREAELEVFERTKEEIQTSEGEDGIVELPHSFRLAPNLTLFTNTIFSRIFTNPSPDFNEVKHSDLICARTTEQMGKVEFLISSEDEEAELVAEKILELKQKTQLEFNGIAVLCRKRKHFKELSEVFTRKKIPFSIVGSKGFYQNQTVLDVFNFLSFLLDNKNDAALMALLRSPFFYFKDNTLLEINFEAGETFFEKLKSFAGKNNRALRTLHILEHFATLIHELPLNELLRKLISETGYLSVIAARENSELQIANLEKLISISNSFQNESFNSFYDFVEFLRSSVEDYDDESEAELIFEEDKVQIMTIHQAKGLEFPAVFLYKTKEDPNFPSVKGKALNVDKDFGIITKVPLGNNFFQAYQAAPIVALYGYYNKRKQEAENKRLLYVAVTRAKDFLFVSASDRKEKEGSFWKLILQGLGIDDVYEPLQIKAPLQFMMFEKDGAKIVTKELAFEIPVIREAKSSLANSSEQGRRELKKTDYSFAVEDVPKNEIFSATRISTYTECPFKYKLIYELGFAKLEKLLEDKTLEIEEKNEDDETLIPANIKGKVIHKVLEKEIADDELQNFIREFLEAEEFPVESIDALEEVVETIKQFRASEEFKFLNGFENYKNELPIYLRQKDYFLFGIIDKLIFTDEKLIIVDYKTDFLKVGERLAKFEHYKNQLFFYAYLVSKYFKSENEIELRLVFVRSPKDSIVRTLTSAEIKEFGKQMEVVIENIKARNFEKKKDYCKECQFSVNGNCFLDEVAS